jgi:hypothetical protein
MSETTIVTLNGTDERRFYRVQYCNGTRRLVEGGFHSAQAAGQFIKRAKAKGGTAFVVTDYVERH